MEGLGAPLGESLRNDTESRMAVFMEVSIEDELSAAFLAFDFRYGGPATGQRLGALAECEEVLDGSNVSGGEALMPTPGSRVNSCERDG